MIIVQANKINQRRFLNGNDILAYQLLHHGIMTKDSDVKLFLKCDKKY